MTKTKKKILGLALSVSMIASCFTGMSVPASADGDTSTYTITIPSTLTVSGSGWNATSGISATGTLGSGKKLTVTASSANSFKLKSGNNEVGYTLTTAEGGSQTTSWEFDSLSSTATTKPLGIIVEDYSSKPAGTYTDTVTFTASVASANNPYAANSVGDVVTFGNYSWYIIGKSDNGVTLLMNANLTTKGYNDSYASVTWETCSLRTYLNGEFYNGSGFSDEDRAKIVKTSITNPNNSDYGTNGGNNTEDYIYLLSIAEANALDSSIRNIGSSWWLRSPGSTSNFAAFVNNSGVVLTNGGNLSLNRGVRPVLNLKF